MEFWITLIVCLGLGAFVAVLGGEVYDRIKRRP